MKTKTFLAIVLLLVAGLQTTWAQGFRVYKSDGTVAQFSLRTDSIVFYDGIGSDVDFGPFTPVNQPIVGTWYKTKSVSMTFNEDGTTDYTEGATYEFMPYQGNIIINNASGAPMNILRVYKVTDEMLVVSTLGSSSFNVWSRTQPVQLVTDITLSETSITLQPDESKTLTWTVLPEDADNKTVTWASSDEAVATVTDGLVVAVADGTCTITCSATDGSGVKAECQVTVRGPENEFTVNGVTFKMIAVEGGTFMMGSNDGKSDEQPVHQVTLSGFSIGETEVTQELWEAVMGGNPSDFSGSKRPVDKVSWNDCQEFITKLNELTEKTFRLPTEAEWEFAARGGNMSNGYTYSGSNTISDVAWHIDNSSFTTHEVATKAPNELGLYDMSGNVCEWCQDWYGDYSSSSQTNPTGPSSGSDRVIRGGCWVSDDAGCRVANRNYDGPTNMYRNSSHLLGFRLAQ